MTYNPVSVKRERVLGDLYKTCLHVDQIPVYMNDPKGEKIGYADESLGEFVDAFSFYLPENICKKLASGQYVYTFGVQKLRRKNGQMIKLKHICLKLKDPLYPPRSKAEMAAPA